jgi:hypothetical protein
MIPMAGKKKEFFSPKDNYRNFSHLLVSEQHKWELDGVEDELLAKIDSLDSSLK